MVPVDRAVGVEAHLAKALINRKPLRAARPRNLGPRLWLSTGLLEASIWLSALNLDHPIPLVMARRRGCKARNRSPPLEQAG